LQVREAFAVADVKMNFDSWQPTEEQYNEFDLQSVLEYAELVGDSAAIAQLINADVSSNMCHARQKLHILSQTRPLHYCC
jgi:hypothetical protein